MISKTLYTLSATLSILSAAYAGSDSDRTVGVPFWQNKSQVQGNGQYNSSEMGFGGVEAVDIGGSSNVFEQYAAIEDDNATLEHFPRRSLNITDGAEEGEGGDDVDSTSLESTDWTDANSKMQFFDNYEEFGTEGAG